MTKSVIGELDIVTTKAVDTIEENPTIIPVYGNSVELTRGIYGKVTIEADNRPGSDHYLFVWRGVRPESLEHFYNCLSAKCRLLKNSNVLVILLRAGVGYGCLQVSTYARIPGIIHIQDKYGHPLLARLDALYEYMRRGGTVNRCFGFMVDFNCDPLKPRYPQTVEEKRLVFNNFIRPFILDMDKASAIYEKVLSLSLADKRKDAVRGYLSELVAMGITMAKEEKF